MVKALSLFNRTWISLTFSCTDNISKKKNNVFRPCLAGILTALLWSLQKAAANTEHLIKIGHEEIIGIFKTDDMQGVYERFYHV
jgi:hypothetical protein